MPFLRYLGQVPYCGGTGVCRFDDLVMTDEARRNAVALCPGVQSVGVVLFPYLVWDSAPRNLSLYACGRDYHDVIREALEPLCASLAEAFPGHRFVPLADASPIPEVQAAWISGAGIRGRSGLIFDRVYGSYVFIGTVLTDLPCAPSLSGRETCPDCGACVRSCPSGALGADGTVDVSRCLSDLTQSKRELSSGELDALRDHPLIWGCDTCSQVCPLNRDVPETPNPAFRENRLTELQPEDVDGMTRKQFLAAYPGRAFTWRGPKPLQRNLKNKSGE